MFSKWIEQLSSCELFHSISREELANMLECLNPTTCRYKKGEYITVAGERFTGIGIVLSGNAAVTKENATGNRVIMAMLGPGEMFGEMAAFSRNRVWPATVVAHGDCTTIFLPSEKIVENCERGCAAHRLLITNMLRIISEKAIMLNRKVEYLAIRSLRGKIGAYLLEQYKKTGKTTFLLPLKRHELADFLNVSRPSLSREMGRMKAEGIIDFHRTSVKIVDLKALQKTVE